MFAGAFNLHVVLQQHFKGGLVCGNLQDSARACELDLKGLITLEHLLRRGKVLAVDLLIAPAAGLGSALNVRHET